jgi:hypothetical protein
LDFLSLHPLSGAAIRWIFFLFIRCPAQPSVGFSFSSSVVRRKPSVGFSFLSSVVRRSHPLDFLSCHPLSGAAIRWIIFLVIRCPAQPSVGLSFLSSVVRRSHPLDFLIR